MRLPGVSEKPPERLLCVGDTGVPSLRTYTGRVKRSIKAPPPTPCTHNTWPPRASYPTAAQAICRHARVKRVIESADLF